MEPELMEVIFMAINDRS